MNNLIKKYFDFEYYREKYPDIKLHCKTYEDCIWHFCGVRDLNDKIIEGDGMKEGRLFNKKLEELISYGYDKYIQENNLETNKKFNVFIHFLNNYDKFKLKEEQLKKEKLKEEQLKQEKLKEEQLKQEKLIKNNKHFDIEFYKQYNTDLDNLSYSELKTHFIDFGKEEGRFFNKKLEELISYGYDKYIQENNLETNKKFNIFIHFLNNYDSWKLKEFNEKILIIYHICHNFGGGTFDYVNKLINILNNYEHQILYTDSFNNDTIINFKSNSIVFVHSFLYNENNILNINYNIYNTIKYFKNKYLIIHDYFLIYPNSPNILKINYKKPLFNDINYLNDIILNFKKVLFNTKSTFDFYNKYINNSNNCIILNDVPDININNFNEYYLKYKNSYNVGILGHINNEHKGYSLCEKLFNNHNNGKYKFIIFGDGNRFNNFNNVCILGKYNNENIFKLINDNNIDFFIFTSLFEETYSFTLSIELNTGLPIIYYDIGCIKERIKNKKNCIPFNDYNINLDNIIIKLIKNTNIINKSNNINYLLKNNLCEFNYFLNNQNYLNIKNKNINNFKNVCFYHFCNINNGHSIFLEQMDKLKKTKLYDILDKIYISFLGKHIKLDLDNKMEIMYYSENVNDMEFYIHEYIYKFSSLYNNNNINILYFHSKGVLKKKNSEAWRKYLEYFLIEKYKDCLKLLEKNIDCIGVNANIFSNNSLNKYRNHFSGNFWWSTSKYIKNLKFNLNKNDRYSCEHYIIGSNRTKNILSLHNINKNLYNFEILPYMYNLDIIKSKILNTYNCLNKKIIGLYFICAIKSYKYRIEKQIQSIINSKLYDNCFIILCYIIANDNDSIYIKNQLQKYNKFILIITNNFNFKENYLFNNYKNYLKHNLKLNIENFNFFYIHNKGSSYDIENKPIDDWCNLNNYFTINKWNLNVKLLEYYDCVGVNFKLYPLKHYSGNFWWTTGNHLNKLKNTIGNKYLDPEMYLMNNVLINNEEYNIYMPNIICLYKSINNHASELYDIKNYINLSDVDIIKNITNIPFINSGDINSININNITFNNEL